jgi:hypothetical protein
MASVALAGPPRVSDNKQACPTMYNSGTLVESSSQVFLCQFSDASLDHGLGISRDISAMHHFAKLNGSRFRKHFSNAQCFLCISGSVLEITFALL